MELIFSILLLVAFGTLILKLIFSGKKNVSLEIKSTSDGKTYVANRKDKVRGNNLLDWIFKDEGGNEIEDEELKKLLFEAFSDEDWHGDYDFYADTKLVKVKQPKIDKV